MPIGPGKYDPLCSLVRKESEAKVAIVIIIDGNKGSGFSVQSDYQIPPNALANVLDQVSEELRASARI